MKPENSFNLFQLPCATSDIIVTLFKVVSIGKSRSTEVRGSISMMYI